MKALLLILLFLMVSPRGAHSATLVSEMDPQDPIFKNCGSPHHNPENTICYSPENHREFDLNLGFVPVRGQETRHLSYYKDQVLFDVTYTVEKSGRRASGLRQDENLNKHAIFMGCSYTFGIGVNSNETLPSYYQMFSQDFESYNFGIGASGPHTALAKLQSGEIKSAVGQDEGVFIYVYLNFQIGRASGFLMESQWGADSPYYEFSKKSGLVRKGSFKSGRPYTTRLYDFMEKNLKYSSRFKQNFPARTVEHTNLSCELIKEMKREYNKQFPKGQFYVFHHPLEGDRSTEVTGCLKSAQISVIDMSHLGSGANPNYKIPIDGHPSGELNQFLAKALVSITAKSPIGHH